MVRSILTTLLVFCTVSAIGSSGKRGEVASDVVASVGAERILAGDVECMPVTARNDARECVAIMQRQLNVMLDRRIVRHLAVTLGGSSGADDREATLITKTASAAAAMNRALARGVLEAHKGMAPQAAYERYVAPAGIERKAFDEVFSRTDAAWAERTLATDLTARAERQLRHQSTFGSDRQSVRAAIEDMARGERVPFATVAERVWKRAVDELDVRIVDARFAAPAASSVLQPLN